MKYVLMACLCYAWPMEPYSGGGRCGLCGHAADVMIPVFDDEQIYARPLTQKEKDNCEKEREDRS